MPLKQKYIV